MALAEPPSNPLASVTCRLQLAGHGSPISTKLAASAPMAIVDTSQRLQHIIDFRDSASPKSKAKPTGVAGCEIWNKVGSPAPTDISQMAYVVTDTATPYLAAYTGAQAGQTACYWLRWVNTRGEKGPWSEPVSATIAG